MSRFNVLAAAVVAVLLAAAASSSSSARIVDRVSLPATTYGDVVIAGGWDNESLSTVEVIHGDSLPHLPEDVTENSLTALGPVLYSCGGFTYEDTTVCYTLDTSESSPRWENLVDLPEPMAHHTATAMGTHIWFVYEDTLYDLDTHTGLFAMYSTPFTVAQDHCAVSSYGISYVVGAGRGKDEVWMNTRENDPTDWERILRLDDKKISSSCLFFEDKIYVTGGDDDSKAVDIINLFTRTVDSTSRLESGRTKHGSFVLDGKAAVAGGYNYDNTVNLRTIETYDHLTNTWTVIDEKLNEPKSDFGCAQFES